MKKLALSLCAILAAANAQKLPYKIFVETSHNPNSPALEQTYKELKNSLSDFEDINILKRASGSYHVVVVETITEKPKVLELLKKIRSLKGHSDAFYLPAPELLEDKDNQKIVEESTKSADSDLVMMLKTDKEELIDFDKTEKTNLNDTTYINQSKENNNTLNDDENASKALEQAMETHEDLPKENLGYSLGEMVTLVVKENPGVLQQKYYYMQTGKDLDIAHREFYPTLNLSGSIGMGKDKVKDNGNLVGDEKWNNKVNKNLELRLIQNLYEGGATEANLRQEEARMRNASYLLLQKSDRTTLQTVEAYLNLLKEKSLLELSEENTKRHEEIFEKIKERSDQGYGRVSEKQQAASRLTLARSNFIAQQNAYEDALTTLQKLTGIQVDVDKLKMPEFSHKIPSNIDLVQSAALMCNPAIRAEEANVNLAQETFKSSNAKFLPRIDLEAYASYEQNHNWNTEKQRIDSYGALLRLNYNLYNKGIDKVTKEKRQVAIQKEQEILEEQKRDLVQSVKHSWQSYVLNDKKLVYVLDHAKYSQETLDSYKQEFNIGRKELINVLDAENEYYQARQEIVRTQNDLLYAKYRILDNMGIITDTFWPGYGKEYIKDACLAK